MEGFEVTLGNRTRDLPHRTPHTHTNQLHQQLYNNFYFISKSLLQNKLENNPQVAKAIRSRLCKNK